MENQEYLKNIVNDYTDNYFRREAVRNIHDQQVLIDMMKNETDELLRMIALLNLEDHATLRYLFDNDPDESIRNNAGEKLNKGRAGAIPDIEELRAGESLILRDTSLSPYSYRRDLTGSANAALMV